MGEPVARYPFPEFGVLGAGAVCQAHAASRGDTLVTVLSKDQRIRAILLISAAAWGGSTATITDARAGQVPVKDQP